MADTYNELHGSAFRDTMLPCVEVKTISRGPGEQSILDMFHPLEVGRPSHYHCLYQVATWF